MKRKTMKLHRYDCFFNFHHWVYDKMGNSRGCSRCPKAQIFVEKEWVDL